MLMPGSSNYVLGKPTRLGPSGGDVVQTGEEMNQGHPGTQALSEVDQPFELVEMELGRTTVRRYVGEGALEKYDLAARQTISCLAGSLLICDVKTALPTVLRLDIDPLDRLVD